jgi:hypothetical protein
MAAFKHAILAVILVGERLSFIINDITEERHGLPLLLMDANILKLPQATSSGGYRK